MGPVDPPPKGVMMAGALRRFSAVTSEKGAMKIAVLHGESAFAASEFEHLTAGLPDHELITWHPGEPPPASDFQILLGVGNIDRKLLESQPKLELVQTTSAGYEGVDVEAATALGIWVSFAPSGETGNAISVAEWAVLLLLASSRDLDLALQSERDPSIKPKRPAQALFGKEVCIIGFGGIGRELVARLRPFGVRFTIVDNHPERAPNDAVAYTAADLRPAMKGADYVVLCIPATPANENFIDATTLASMKRGAILINVARGTLVDEPALQAALASGHIRAAGLDVLRNEPPAISDPLVDAPYSFVTPHMAGSTDVTIEGTARYVATILDTFADGRRWKSLLNDPPSPRRPLHHDAATGQTV
jgi:phosphoglycerate dehydrogenase-like enzyme